VTRSAVLFFFAALRLSLAASAADIARETHEISLDPEGCYRVIDLNLAKEDLKVYLTSGYLVFAKPIHGVRYGAVFVTSADGGDAEVLLMPPSRGERLSMATFTGSPNLEEHFNTAVFIFTDGTGEDLRARLESKSQLKKSPETGNLIADQWTSTLRNFSASFETRVVGSLLSGDSKSGFFYMAVSGNQLHNFDLLYDPANYEQIFAGQLGDHNNRSYFDTWTSFPSRSIRNGAAPPAPPLALDNFRIDSSIDDNLAMESVTRATLTLKRQPGRAIPLSISSKMRITGASIDGRPVEVFDQESLRSNLIVGNGDREFLLVTESPLDPSQPHEIEVRAVGEVIQKAGSGVYYVTSRGTWYPRSDISFANYDLTFRYPKNLVLVTTGAPLEDRIEGATRITRRKTESPIRFAGFNLGDFQSASITENGNKIDVYANRRIESALQLKPAPPESSIQNPWWMARRHPTPGLAESMPPLPADPSGRLGLLLRDVVDTIDFMTAEFGPPPIRNLAITPIPGGFGQGFPGLVYLSTLAYLDPDQRPPQFRQRFEQTFYSELLEIHEVAHQWWGNLVAPASYRDEWLMEALANYSALLMIEKTKGVKAAEAVLDDYRSQLLGKSENGRTVESSGPITWGFRLESSLSPDAWRIVTYHKGTWIMHMLRRRLGDEKFLSLLREISNRYRFSTISTEQFRELAAAYMPPKSEDRALQGFFENWVYGVGIPAVKLSYSWRGSKLSGTLTQADVGDDFTAFVPVEVQAARQRKVYWLPTGSDPTPFSIPLTTPPTKVALLANDCLIAPSK
jgi:hypothetical protein